MCHSNPDRAAGTIHRVSLGAPFAWRIFAGLAINSLNYLILNLIPFYCKYFIEWFIGHCGASLSLPSASTRDDTHTHTHTHTHSLTHSLTRYSRHSRYLLHSLPRYCRFESLGFLFLGLGLLSFCRGCFFGPRPRSRWLCLCVSVSVCL